MADDEGHEHHEGTKRKWTPYIGAAVGTVLVYIIYERYKASQAAASTATSDGNTVPAVDSTDTGGSSGTTTTSPISTIAEWTQAFLGLSANATYTNSQALNDLSAWLNGQCVSSAGYTAIGNAVASLGNVPGYSSIQPTLSVCPQAAAASTPASAPATAPAAAPTGGGGAVTPAAAPPANPHFSADAIQKYLSPGDSIVGEVYDAVTQTWVAVSKNGGVFTENSSGSPGGVFYGSYQGLPSADTQGTRSFTGVTANPDGTYTLKANDGATYTFGPGTPQT